jgi:CubicO group peptidase (beta-lactamase class C family)
MHPKLLIVVPLVFFLLGGGTITKAQQAAALKDLSAEEGLAASIDAVANKAIQEKNIPGAVILVGHRGQVIFKKAYGHRSLDPQVEPMTPDTIFDMASLTKVLATAPAVMLLIEKGKIHLDDRVANYLPPFGQQGKKKITIRQLLTHYGGLPGDLPDKEIRYTNKRKPSARAITRKIYAVKLKAPPGERFIYSDLGYVVLGKLVEKVTGKGLNQFTHEVIFAPLKMRSTEYRPSRKLMKTIAPTEKKTWGEVVRGKVQDPTAYLLGGVAGHAGIFSTADDLARFGQMFLNGGSLEGVPVLLPETVRQMTSPQSPATKKDIRGFGWDIETDYSTLRGSHFSSLSYGHTGYTGTSIWIDPPSQSYVIILTNRLHPENKGNVKELRISVADLVGAAVNTTTK